MNPISSERTLATVEESRASSTRRSQPPQGRLTQAAAWINDRAVGFVVTSLGMIVMLLWAGAFKMTAPGAEGITPLLAHSPLTALQLRVLGPYRLSDIIGLTEWTAALLYLAGYRWPKAGIVAGFITVVMFFTTSSMLITTPGTTVVVHGIHYMNNLGLFLFKDVIALGASFFLIVSYGKRAAAKES